MESSKSKDLVPEKVIGSKSKRKEMLLSTQNTIIYNLGIGFSTDQLKKEDFKFTYELSEEFTILPTYSVVVPIIETAPILSENPYIPEFNFMTLLHGEQWLECIKPLKPNTTVFTESEITDLEDKGKGTIFCIETKIYNEDNSLATISRAIVFVRGIKGSKYKSTGILSKISVPSKLPDSQPTKTLTYKTSPNQALLYRLGGNDPNPLHVDPDMAAMGGFEKPILHGLCSYGIAAKLAFDEFCKDNIENFVSFNSRFTSHVFPGETLEFNYWSVGNGRIIVNGTTKERGKQILIGEIIVKSPKF